MLDLTGARLPRSDIRRIILMDHDLIIGPTRGAHIVAEELDHPIVLHLRDGQIFSQSQQPIILGAATTIDHFTFVVTAG